MKLKIPAGLYDAAARLQRHCAKHDNSCLECCFNELKGKSTGNGYCILMQMPEDWGDFDIERVSNVVRPQNAGKEGKK